VTNTLPLTAAQSRLWLERRVTPDRDLGDVTFSVELPAALDEEALRAAIEWLMRRHDAFRVRLDSETPRQLLGEPELRYEVAREDAITRVRFTMRRECCDARSFEIIERELASAYEAFARGDQPRTDVSLAYVDASEIASSEQAVPAWCAPTRLRPELTAEATISGAAAVVQRAWNARPNFSDEATQLAAFLLLMQRYSGAERMVVGVAIDCRDATSSNVVGCFTSTVPLTVDMGGNPTTAQLVECVRLALQHARNYASLSFDRLLAILQPERESGRHPLFEIVFANSTVEHVAAQRAQFDLLFSAGDVLRVVHRDGFWPRAWAETLLAQFEHVLGQFANAPSQRIDELALNAFDDPIVAIDVEPLTRTFRTQAERTPDAVVIEESGAAVTYAQLAAHVDVIVAELRANGIRESDCVAVQSQSWSRTAAVALAVLECRGAVLRVEDGAPPLRVEALCTVAAARFIVRENDISLCDRQPAHVSARSSCGIIEVEAYDDGMLVATLLDEHDLARMLRAQRELLELDERDRVSVVDGCCDLSEMLLPLSAGACLTRTLDAATVTILLVQPAAAQIRISRMLRPETMPRLRFAIFSGDALSDALVQSWRRNMRGAARIINMYEGVCAGEVAEPPLPGAQPIGHTLAGLESQLALLTKSGRRCGPGERGLLHVRGRARDVARMRSDGLLEVLEPHARTVNIAGKRVQPGEIERALRLMPLIAEAHVTTRGGMAGERMLVAQLVPFPDATLDAAAITAELSAQFPPSMLPSLVLNQPVSLKRDEHFLAPRDPLELQLARIWEELLTLPSLGVRDDFFERGGDSLLAVEMLARVAKELGTSLDANVLLPDATIERLAAMLRQPSHDASPLVIIQRGSSPLPLVCVHPSGGSILCYVDLARALGARQTVPGLRGSDVRRSGLAPPDIASMAATYAEALQTFTDGRPIALAGYSFGGLVAMELARRLDDRVQFVALLDTRFPREYGPADRNPVVDLGEVLEHHDLDDDTIDETAEHELWRELMELSARYLPKSGSSARRRGSFSAVQEFCRIYRLMPAAGELGYRDLRRFLRNLRANFRAMRAHQPLVSDAPVLLVAATQTIDGETSDHVRNAALWRSVASRLEVETIDANHFNLLAAPAVDRVASILQSWLART
jgi:thioesterase domain-containing protein/non-ribosomal peptide synthetase component F